LRSGLALPEANQGKSGGEDGLLTALEAAGLDLGGTKLVALSACETGVGQLGERVDDPVLSGTAARRGAEAGAVENVAEQAAPASVLLAALIQSELGPTQKTNSPQGIDNKR
jgi:CHAT domain-containing protein